MAFDLGNISGMAGDAKNLSALPGMWDDVEDKDWHGFYERIDSAKS